MFFKIIKQFILYEVKTNFMKQINIKNHYV